MKVAQKIGVSDRWVRTLLKRMKKQGDAVVVHGLRGRASNRKLTAEVQAQAMEIRKQPLWQGFGPTFAAEQLAKLHQLEISKETLRAWMIEAGCGSPARVRLRSCIAGGRGGVRSESWCNGTLPSTTGWKDEDRCPIWCG